MELEDVVEKIRKQNKAERKLVKKRQNEERIKLHDERTKLMKFTSSIRYKLSGRDKSYAWRVYKARRKSYYKYPRGVVYIANIPHGFYEEQMVSYFTQFGKVTGIYMPRAPSGKIRGYAFVEFQLEVVAKIVADTMNNYLFYQRMIKAKYIPPENQKPYMFVYPFGDLRKKSLRIAAERKRRIKSLNENQVEEYKRKIDSKVNLMKKKMALLGVNYTIQLSGQAPKPVEKKVKTTDNILKTEPEDNSNEVEQELVDDKLTKQIKKKIAAKLSKPLGQKIKEENSKQDTDISDDDNGTDDDDDPMDLINESDFGFNLEGYNDDSMSEDSNDNLENSKDFIKLKTKKLKLKNKSPEGFKIGKEVKKSINNTTPKSSVEKTSLSKNNKNTSQIKTPKTTPGIEKKIISKTPKTLSVGKKLDKSLKNTTPVTSNAGKKPSPSKSNKKTSDIKTPKTLSVGKESDKSLKITTPKTPNAGKKSSPSKSNKNTSSDLKTPKLVSVGKLDKSLKNTTPKTPSSGKKIKKSKSVSKLFT